MLAYLIQPGAIVTLGDNARTYNDSRLTLFTVVSIDGPYCTVARRDPIYGTRFTRVVSIHDVQPTEPSNYVGPRTITSDIAEPDDDMEDVSSVKFNPATLSVEG